ncbi:hypothetical protein N431DRAFT_479871 [Stipitochalara longipes BDJ]|nr:hypothetical protein N431DRAFT_479871 [Stipitochalara longipes BDJ]
MQSFLLALSVGAAIVSASGKKCAQNDISELISRTTCGSSKSIAACLGASVDLESFEAIEQCFIGGGCSGMAAEVEAILFLAQECHFETGADERGDLRKRADTSTKATNAKTTATNAKTTTNAEATTTSDASDTSSASAAASSTAAAPSSTTSVDSTTTAATSSTDSTTTSASAASVTGPTSCYVTSIKSTSACSISAGTTVTCTPTTTAIQSCAPGLLCFSATAGADSCMKREDNLTTSGLIVTIIFAGGIGAALLAWAILCLRSRNRTKRQEQLRRMMASSGKGEDIESISPFDTRPTTRSRAMGSDANLPLITPGAERLFRAWANGKYTSGAEDTF